MSHGKCECHICTQARYLQQSAQSAGSTIEWKEWVSGLPPNNSNTDYLSVENLTPPIRQSAWVPGEALFASELDKIDNALNLPQCQCRTAAFLGKEFEMLLDAVKERAKVKGFDCAIAPVGNPTEDAFYLAELISAIPGRKLWPICHKGHICVSSELMKKSLGISDHAFIRDIRYDPENDTYDVFIHARSPCEAFGKQMSGTVLLEGSPLIRECRTSDA